jgi:excisionase family DNA binding protein
MTILRISRGTIYQLLRSGELRSIKIRSRRLIPAAAINDYITTSLGRAA